MTFLRPHNHIPSWWQRGRKLESSGLWANVFPTPPAHPWINFTPCKTPSAHSRMWGIQPSPPHLAQPDLQNLHSGGLGVGHTNPTEQGLLATSRPEQQSGHRQFLGKTCKPTCMFTTGWHPQGPPGSSHRAAVISGEELLLPENTRSSQPEHLPPPVPYPHPTPTKGTLTISDFSLPEEAKGQEKKVLCHPPELHPGNPGCADGSEAVHRPCCRA